MSLPLATGLTFGFQTRMAAPDEVRKYVGIAETYGYSSISLGDHLAFAVPIADPLIQFAAAAVLTRKVTMIPAVYLLPLRNPAAVAKQVATLDRMCEGRLIFGVGSGGEFATDYASVQIPLRERGARLTEGIEVLRKLWTGEKVSHQGRFYPFENIQMLPTPYQNGGPPIWVGGRSEAALARAGRQADGYVAYVITPDMYKAAVDKIAAAAEAAKRRLTSFGTAHLLFARLGKTREEALDVAARHLSVRYAMDFRKATERYCALGTPADVAAHIARFHAAGTRYVILDMIGDPAEREGQLQQFAQECIPLLTGLK